MVQVEQVEESFVIVRERLQVVLLRHWITGFTVKHSQSPGELLRPGRQLFFLSAHRQGQQTQQKKCDWQRLYSFQAEHLLILNEGHLHDARICL